VLREIREFRNTDPRQLVSVWQAYYAQSGLSAPMNAAVFENCIASKVYVDSSGLLVSVGERGIDGFVHIGFGGRHDGSEVSYQRAFLSALCVVPSDTSGEVATQLFQAAESYARSLGSRDMIAIGEPREVPFYLGLAPGDGMLGVLAEERQLQQWLTKFGFAPCSESESWELVLGQYRQPMDRNQMQIRRQTYVNKMLSEPEIPWWYSCVLGQAELFSFQLNLREENRIHSRVIFWQHDPAILGSALSPLRLWPLEIPVQVEDRERLLYLLAESLRQLQMDRFVAVRYCADALEPSTASILQRLGFRLRQSGMRYRKAISA